MDEQPSITRFLVLGTLETLLNQMLDLTPGARERLADLHGTVVRVRAERPMVVIYLLIYDDGIEVLQDFEGHVDVRVRAPLGALLQWILSPSSVVPEEDGIRILGPEEKVARLTDMVTEFSLVEAVRQWLDSHVQLDQLLGFLRREDPEWLQRLQGLPGQLTELSRELARQRLLQEDILQEIRHLKGSLRRERRMDMAVMFLGLVLLLFALGIASGDLPLLAGQMERAGQALLLGSLGLTVILSRVIFGHHYD